VLLASAPTVEGEPDKGFQAEIDTILADARASRRISDMDTDLGESQSAESDELGWAGEWKTDMGQLILTQVDREVYGTFESSSTATSLLGIITSDPSTLVGEIQMSQGQAGFKLVLNKDKWTGAWWWPNSKDKMPWTAGRSEELNSTVAFDGPINVGGSIEAQGMLGASGLQSSTLTTPSTQESLAYMISAVSCGWRRVALDPSCGAGEGATWGGMANVKGVSAEGPSLNVQFTKGYAGSPICFVSFGGKNTKLDYSIDTSPGGVSIFLNKNGCCSSEWQEFDGKFSLMCHGAAAA